MAEVGVDAMIMDETDENLKDKVGSAAYFVAAGKALGRLPVRMTVQLDDNRPVRRDAMLCLVGNVGKLGGNLTLIPGARLDDGVLDLDIASPRRLRHWIKLVLRLIARRPKRDDQVDQHSGSRVGIRYRREGQLPARRRCRRRVHHPDGRDPARRADGPHAGSGFRNAARVSKA